MKYDYLVVGAGLYGSVFAHEAATRGKRVLVVDKRPNIAGNVYECILQYGYRALNVSVSLEILISGMECCIRCTR